MQLVPVSGIRKKNICVWVCICKKYRRVSHHLFEITNALSNQCNHLGHELKDHNVIGDEVFDHELQTLAKTLLPVSQPTFLFCGVDFMEIYECKQNSPHLGSEKSVGEKSCRKKHHLNPPALFAMRCHVILEKVIGSYTPMRKHHQNWGRNEARRVPNVGKAQQPIRGPVIAQCRHLSFIS